MHANSFAARVADTLAAADTNPDNARTWRQRARAANAFNRELITAMGDRPLFVVRFPGLPFLRKTVPWSWLLRPMAWAFDAAVDTLAPTDEQDVAPRDA